MSEAILVIKNGILDVFPDLGDVAITHATRLEEIPGWDSMASVNLQMFLMEAFNAEIPDDLLGGRTTIGEIITHLAV